MKLIQLHKYLHTSQNASYRIWIRLRTSTRMSDSWYSHNAKAFTKRSELEDVEDDDLETIVDALVRALHNPEVMTNFVECICALKFLLTHLLAT